VNKLTRNSTTKTARSTQAIVAEIPAMPVKPKMAATMASRKNRTTNPSIIFPPSILRLVFYLRGRLA
jgi:hypothetical protein